MMKILHALLAASLVLYTLAPRDVRQPIAIDSVPFVIEKAGDYFLPRDLHAPLGAFGVHIRASDVRIDLRGHRLIGAAGRLHGILADAGLERIVVRNGTVLRFGYDGVDLSGVTGARLEKLTLFDNGGHGGSLGDDGEASEITADFNHGGYGLWAGARARLREVRVKNNTFGGVRAGIESSLVDCAGDLSIYGHGLRVGRGSVLRGCTAQANGDGGIVVDPGSMLYQCRASRNLAFGLRAGERSLMIECEALGTLDGPGIELAPGATADGCIANENRLAGIVAGAGSVVRGCRALANGTGIEAASALLIADSICAGSLAGEGLAITGSGTTVRGNRALENFGADLVVRGSAHAVYGNTARRGRYEIEAGNAVGPWVESGAGDALANEVVAD